MLVKMAGFGDIAKEMNCVYALTTTGIKPQQTKLKKQSPVYHRFPKFAVVHVSRDIFLILDLNKSHYLNANKNNFDFKKKTRQFKKNGKKKENPNILHANSVIYLQSFRVFFFYKCTLYM